MRAEIEALLARGEQQDEVDDARLGEGVAEIDIPAEIHRREARLARIESAKAALEAEARMARAAQLREQAERARSAAAQAENERERTIALARAERREEAARAVESRGVAADATDGDEAEESCSDGAFPEHAPKVTSEGFPKPAAQRNFTDPDSRIMERGGEIVQAYNGQIAVDGESQIIVAHGLSNQAPDTYYLVPMLERVRSTAGALPEKISADTGFWAPTNAMWCEEQQVDAYIATQRQRRSVVPPDATATADQASTPQQEMRAKVASSEGQEIYRRRKCIVEPVFGQIKQAMGFRRFSMRGWTERGESGHSSAPATTSASSGSPGEQSGCPRPPERHPWSTTGACADTQIALRATQPGERSGWRRSPRPCKRPERARAGARSWAGEEHRALRATGS